MLGSSNTTLNAQFFSDRDTSHREVDPVLESSSKLQAVLAHLKNVTRCDHSKITNLSDSTFLNIHDIGSQPGMLPALIHGPAMYLVCFNMLSQMVQVFNRLNKIDF